MRLRQAPSLSILAVGLCCVVSVPAARAQQREAGASAQVSLEEIDNQSHALLEQADALLANGQWLEALENVQRVRDQSGTRMIEMPLDRVSVTVGFRRYLSVDEYCQMWMSRLAQDFPEALAFYRSQVDSLAKQWLDASRNSNDEVQLEQLVDRMFLSSWGDEATDRLAESALQRGDFQLARSLWERLSPLLRIPPQTKLFQEDYTGYPTWLLIRATGQYDAETLRNTFSSADGSPTWLVYPDTNLDLGQLRARLALTSILEGNLDRAHLEVTLLKTLHPTATGTIGGRRGRLGDLLAQLLAESSNWSSNEPDANRPCFGAGPDRQGAGSDSALVHLQKAWEHPLPVWQVTDSPANWRVAETPDALLSYHPTGMGNQILLRTGTARDSILCLDRADGEIQFGEIDIQTDTFVAEPDKVPRFTIASDGRWAYAVTAATATTPSTLFAVDLAAEGKLQLELDADPEEPENWQFEGTPVIHAGRLYAAVRRRVAVRPEIRLHCYGARDGQLRWQRTVGRAGAELAVRGGIGESLISVQGRTLVYNSNVGVIAAFDRVTGRPRWAVSYPRASTSSHPDEDNSQRFRDLTPCLLYREFVVAAPRDCESIFALDESTGGLLWVTPPDQASDVVHLLGVGQGNLIASGDCLYWFDLRTGRNVGYFPGIFRAAPGHARPKPQGRGRGALGTDQVYWPTERSIYVFDQRTIKNEQGWQPQLVRKLRLPSPLRGGNLLVTRNQLILAGPDSVVALREKQD